MPKHVRRTVRQMPKIYGNLQKPPRFTLAGFGRRLYLLLWVAVGGGIVYAVAFSGWFSVHSVQVQGTSFLSEAQVAALVPKNTPIWLVSKDEIAGKVMQDRRVLAVSVFRGLPDSVRIVVQEKKPAMLWLSGTTCSVLDAQGIAFAQYPSAGLPPASTPLGKALRQAVTVTDTQAVPVALGGAVISPVFITFVSQASQNLATYLPELKIGHLEVGASTTDVTFVAEQGMRVSFDTLADPGVQVRNLARLVHQKKATLASKVDLRIDRWAYVQ